MGESIFRKLRFDKDYNSAYRRLTEREVRYEMLLALEAPDILLKHEERLLYEMRDYVRCLQIEDILKQLKGGLKRLNVKHHRGAIAALKKTYR